MDEKNKNLMTPISFFSIYNFPLTAVEVWQWQYKTGTGLSETKKLLDEMVGAERLGFKQGFYFLPGYEKNVIIRLKRFNIAEEKFKRVKLIGWFLARCPFVKMIAVCNTLAYSNAEENSDIDLFIVTAKNRIWIGRFWAQTLIKLLGLQPDPRNMKNKFCLSFFVTEDAMDLQKCLLPEKDGWPDIYFLFWFITLYPVYDAGNVFLRLWQKNSWVKGFFPLASPVQTSKRRAIGVNFVCRGVKVFKDVAAAIFGNMIYKKMQLMILPKSKKAMANKDTRVILNDQMLKFHDNDRRENIREEFINRS